MSFDAAGLFRLLPAIHRLRDTELAASTAALLTPAEAGRLAALDALPAPTEDEQAERNALREKAMRGPLATLLSVLADEIAVVEENLEQLHDDSFIETCADWAIPYIGDLIGYEPLHALGAARGLARAEVAHTIALRRRKGTAAALEQIARDVTMWNARAVEFFQLLATTQYMNHRRPWNHYAPDLRRWEPLARIGSAFDSVAHTVDVRRVESGRGRFNIPNVGIFLWRLDAHRHTGSTAVRVDDRRHLFSPLGHPLQLFTRPRAEDEITHLAEPANVPDPIGRRFLKDHLASYYGTHPAGAADPDNAEPSIVLYVNDAEVPREQIVACHLGDHGAAWAHVPPDGTYGIDPVLGRIAVASNLAVPASVRVTYHYGFSADMGGGEYPRQRDSDPEGTKVVRVPQDRTTIAAALADVAGDGVVEIRDSGRYEEDLAVVVKEDKHVVLRAAPGCFPVLVLGAEMTVSGAPRSEFTLEGLLVSGAPLVVPDDATNLLARLRIAHATLVPGRTLNAAGGPVVAGAESLVIGRPDVETVIERSIVGALHVHEAASLSASDSIVDATSDSEIAYAGHDGVAPGGKLSLEACTVIGNVLAECMVLVSNSILLARRDPPDLVPAVRAMRRQTGCVRFTYLPPDSLVPRRHRCQPEGGGTGASVAPHFTTTRYGVAAYCQLRRSTPDGIRRGADDESEMGAFHNLYPAQREAGLRTRLSEYLRVGLSAGVFHAT